jgi:YVTN family beta-propeller protein
MANDDHEKLADALLAAGKRASYPPTPPLAARVRARLESGQQPVRRGFGLWGGLATAGLTLLVVLGAAFLYTYTNQQAAAPAAPGTAYTANLASGDLSAVDLAGATLIRNIKVGDSPWGMAIAPSGKRVYVSVADGITMVDTTRKERTDFVPLPSGYARSKVAISGDERILLAASPSGLMTLIDMPTRGVLNQFSINMVPYDIKLSPDGHFAYVLGAIDGALLIADVRTGTILQRLTFSGPYPAYFVGQSPDGRYLYVPRLGKSEMWIVDTQTNQARGTLTEQKAYWQGDPDGGAERGIAISHDGKRMFVATMDARGGGVSVLDTQDFHELARVNVGNGFFGAALSLDGSRLVLSMPNTSRLLVYDAQSLNLLANVEVGTAPYRVVVGP